MVYLKNTLIIYIYLIYLFPFLKLLTSIHFISDNRTYSKIFTYFIFYLSVNNIYSNFILYNKNNYIPQCYILNNTLKYCMLHTTINPPYNIKMHMIAFDEYFILNRMKQPETKY